MKDFSFSIIIVTIILGSLLFSSNAFSEEELTYKDKLEYCNSLETAANNIMEARQVGVPMSTLIEVEAPEEIRKMMHGLIIEAFSVPRYNVESNQKEAILDFKNEVYLSCIEAVM